ncbi:MAG: FAD-dependent oxidoreductase [bacterium]|nr:FAD-dependent oxidoreductase [bacterium]
MPEVSGSLSTSSPFGSELGAELLGQRAHEDMRSSPSLAVVKPSHKYRFLIIGGGIAGTTAAETLRKREPDATIAIVTDEPYRLYSRVLLSKPAFLTGEHHVDSAWLKTEAWYREQKIDLMVAVSAHELDPETKTVRLSNGDILGYEKLLLALGTHSRKWYIPGRDKLGVHNLRTLDDAKGIIDDLHAGKKHAVMIGSSCVTYEVADILRSKGIEVTEIMRERYFWEPTLSKEEAEITEKQLVERGVTLLPETEVTEILGDAEVMGVVLKDKNAITCGGDGRTIDCDMVFAFIGIVLPVEWLTSSGIALEHGIIANEYLETSIPDVYTAGDCARYKDTILGDSVIMGSWMNAVKQGEVAAGNMLGDKKPYALISFHSSHGFGDMISFAGDARMRPDRECIMRGSTAERKLGRIILSGGRVVGATMVNRTQELATLVKLISLKTDVTGKKAELADVNFDLKTLLPK